MSCNIETRKFPDEAQVLLKHPPQRLVPPCKTDARTREDNVNCVGETGIDGTLRILSVAVSVLVLPLSFILAILLYIEVAYRVNGRTTSASSIPFQLDQNHPSAFLVNFSATRLTTLASWASNIATLLPGLLMNQSRQPM